MADSNSKKPMALLLLVVVAVLVVIMLNPGGNDFTSHADLTTKEACDTHGGAWSPTMKAVENWKAEADANGETCKATDGNVYTPAVKPVAGVGKEGDANYVAEVKEEAATCMMVDAEADPAGTCAADYASKTTKETCEAGHGAWNEAVAEDLKADPKVEAKDAFCGEPVAAE